MLNQWLLDFMHPSYLSYPKVIVVSEKEYEKQKNKAALSEIQRSTHLADIQLKQVERCKSFLTDEMTKATKKEEEIISFQEKLKKQKEELTQTD